MATGDELKALLREACEYIESEYAYPGWETRFGEPNPTAQFVKKCYAAIQEDEDEEA